MVYIFDARGEGAGGGVHKFFSRKIPIIRTRDELSGLRAIRTRGHRE